MSYSLSTIFIDRKNDKAIRKLSSESGRENEWISGKGTFFECLYLGKLDCGENRQLNFSQGESQEESGMWSIRVGVIPTQSHRPCESGEYSLQKTQRIRQRGGEDCEKVKRNKPRMQLLPYKISILC